MQLKTRISDRHGIDVSFDLPGHAIEEECIDVRIHLKPLRRQASRNSHGGKLRDVREAKVINRRCRVKRPYKCLQIITHIATVTDLKGRRFPSKHGKPFVLDVAHMEEVAVAKVLISLLGSHLTQGHK